MCMRRIDTMKTTRIHQFIHDVPKNSAYTNKKSGAHGRIAKGEAIGVAVAQVMDDKTYAIQVSLTHPGHEKRGGLREGADKFDKHIAVTLALGKIMDKAPLPRVCTMPASTHRAKFIQTQFDSFLLQASKVFKDKQIITP